MNLGYPIGLLACAGLIIPVIIHLWNIKQGKTLKIGSIIFLGESSSETSRSLKLTDLLLFLLRCLLLILIGLYLAQPYLVKKIKATQGGWILVEKPLFSNAYQTNKRTIDSLLSLRYELHDFNIGFAKFEANDTVSTSNNAKALSYTALLNQLDQQVCPGLSVYLFANPYLNKFDDNWPKHLFNLNWTAINTPDSLKTWTTTFLDRTYTGNSSPTLTSYTPIAIAPNSPTISVIIHDPAGGDSKYISACLYAISEFTKRKIEIKSWTKGMIGQADVGFWLADKPMDPLFLTRLKKDANLLTYELGKMILVNTNVDLNLDANEQGQQIEMYKKILPHKQKGRVVWADDFGDPILIAEKMNKLTHFHFYSRFNPQWADLVWNEKFVTAMMPIVLNHQEAANFGFEEHPSDQRVLPKNQLLEQQNQLRINAEKIINQSFSNILWIIAFIVLVLERSLTFSKKTSL